MSIGLGISVSVKCFTPRPGKPLGADAPRRRLTVIVRVNSFASPIVGTPDHTAVGKAESRAIGVGAIETATSTIVGRTFIDVDARMHVIRTDSDRARWTVGAIVCAVRVHTIEIDVAFVTTPTITETVGRGSTSTVVGGALVDFSAVGRAIVHKSGRTGTTHHRRVNDLTHP